MSFNFNNYIKYTGVNKDLSLTIAPLNGKVYITVWNNKASDFKDKKIFSIIATLATLIMTKNYLNKAILGGPGTRNSIIISDWDNNQKKFTNKKTITIGKDENMTIFISVSGDKLTNQEMFLLKVPKKIDSSPDSLTDDKRSIIEATALVEQLDALNVAILLSRDKESMAAAASKFSKYSGNNNNSYNDKDQSSAMEVVDMSSMSF
jgi:hypothetical protein